MKFNLTNFICFQLLLFFLAGNIYSQESDCRKVLDQAYNLYYEGNFNESANLVQSCLSGMELKTDELCLAYKILSQVELARGNEKKAKENIRQILKSDPDYQPTIEQETPTFVQLVKTVRQETVVSEQKKSAAIKKDSGGISKWWYYSAGVVVAGTTYLLLNKDDNKKKSEPLPYPPDWE